MADWIFLTFVLVGLAILIRAVRRIGRDGADQSRAALGGLLALAGVWLWLANAVNLVYRSSFYVGLETLAGAIFFVGLALFVPKPDGEERLDRHRLPAHLIMWIGLAVTTAHVAGLAFSQTWPDIVLRAYAAIGLRGAGTPPPGP